MRRLVLLALLALLATTPSALGVSRVVGGGPLDVRQAPWSVLIVYQLGGGGTLCTGAILDSRHILTAAHCLVDKDVPYDPTHLRVVAGVTDAAAPSPTDRPQTRGVASFRLHRGYRDADRTGADDVAVIELASPLRLRRPTATSIALPGASYRWKEGDGVGFAGFGTKASTSEVDGTLNAMTGTLVDQTECMRKEDNAANGVLLCVFSGSGSPCGGDSGGALVSNRASPVVVGIARAAVEDCSPDSAASFTDVTSPEILRFIRGSDKPPTAPRPAGPTTLERPTANMQVGQTVTCKPGTWSGSPRLSYEFREDADGTVLRAGRSATYRLGDVDGGRKIFCRVVASNGGGRTFADSAVPGRNVEIEPELSVQPTTARRGGVATVRVNLFGWVRPLGKVSVCVHFSPRVGGKACRTATPAGSTPTVVMQLKVKPTAPLVRARASVTARAADGREALAPAFVVVT